MKIAVLSDTHDNLWRLEQALPALRMADAILHCGDVCSPFLLRRLAEGVGDRPIHLVWGNNDGDRLLLARIAAQAGTVYPHGEFATLELGGWRIALTHYPEVARAVARSEAFDLVCYGHDHQQYQEQVGGTLLLNPGELFGGLTGRSTWALVDTQTGQVTVQELA